ncbi:MAG: hypothetical protein LAT51_07090 [Flavobacteriaceae bacterium]|nr:hypothetical protein [Flavobacteriaceae bacterium]
MGHLKEPKGIDLIVDNQPLNSKMEKRIKEFIKKSKKRNNKFLEKYANTSEK